MRLVARLMTHPGGLCTRVNSEGGHSPPPAFSLYSALLVHRRFGPLREPLMAEQVPFGNAVVELASNPEPRCPCVLVLDVSGSMAGAPVAALNGGLQTFQTELQGDSLAAQRVEVAVVTFGGRVQTVCEFQSAQNFQPPTLVVGGETPMGEAIRRGVDLVTQRKKDYKQAGLHYFRPWVFLITDGAPSDEWQSAADLIRRGEAEKSFAFFSVGVEGANFDLLRQLTVRAPLKLDGLKFGPLFVWLSQSMRSISQSNPGEEAKVALPNPSGWASL